MRMLIYVPRMYTKDEFKKLTSEIPEDFDAKSKEFWDYVEEKLKPLFGRVRKVYQDSLYEGGEKGIKILLSDPNSRNYLIIQKLVENGAELGLNN